MPRRGPGRRGPLAGSPEGRPEIRRPAGRPGICRPDRGSGPAGLNSARIIHEASTARTDKADLTGVLGPRALRRSAPTTSRALGPAGARDLGLLRALATNPRE